MKQRDYCICWPRDGLLYVEVPNISALKRLLLSQRFEREAHFHTIDGYVPYYGGALAFDAQYLIAKAVKPYWYLVKGGDRVKAEQQLIEDRIFEDEHEVYQFDGHQYGDECEWIGSHGFRFEAKQVRQVYVFPKYGREEKAEDVLAALMQFAPKAEFLIGKPIAEKRHHCK